MARQVRSLSRAYREPVTILAESEGALVARSFLLGARHVHKEVDQLITLDMPSGIANVYFPSKGRQGWGVGTGWGLRGFAKLLAALGPLHLSADSPLARELLDCRPAFARLAAAPPPPGVSEVAVEALADWVDPPGAAPASVPRFVVAATHGGLVADPSVQQLIRGILEGDPSDIGPRVPGLWARVVGASASPWLVPSLPPGVRTGAVCRLSG